MSSINDWAIEAAHRIIIDLPPHRGQQPNVERIAAIIATFAEPLVALLQESRREHFQSCDALLNYDDDGKKQFDNPCTCGADIWNRKIDEALS